MCCRDGIVDLTFWAGLPEVVWRTIAGLFIRQRSATPTPRGVVARAAILSIEEYQRVISSRTPARCRFTPTCSQFGLAAVQKYGVLAGLRMVWHRLRRCATSVPLGTPDPLPERS
jgi:putative membrane protein insertion efficiency factor